jgi:thiol-disulfide isomerase/thioredoxin
MKAGGALLLLLAATAGAAAQPLAEWHDRAAIAGTELVGTDGKPLHIGDFRGKVVVIDFWGAWCESCLREMDSLKRLQHALADERSRVAFLFVSVEDKGFEKDAAWFKASGLAGADYRWRKRTGEQYHAFFRTSNARWWVPDALILDPAGNTAKVIMGGGTDWSKETEFVRNLLSAQSGLAGDPPLP